MRAFDGKSKTIQFQIAADFNTLTIDESLNVHDLVQKYCSELASVGDGTGNPVHLVCHHCDLEGHMKSDCPSLKKESKNVDKRRSNDDAKKARDQRPIICHHCGVPGHKRPNCPQRQTNGVNLAVDTPAEQAEAAAASSPPPANNTSLLPSVNMVTNTASLSHEALQQLVSQLGGGTYPVRMVKVSPVYVDRIALSLCDGMGTCAYMMGLIDANITRFIGVENNPVARTVCDNLNPSESSHFGGVDHSWHTDVFSITESDIVGLGPGAIAHLAMAPPCEDMSLLRLLSSRVKMKGKMKGNVRPELKGKKG